jgi:hypothetical protein
LDLTLTSAITKQLDADWAAGNNAGGRYVSSANNPAISNTTYHLHLIGKADGTVDAMFYTGADPTAVLPTGYIDYRRVCSVVRESASIVQFDHINGNTFMRKVPVRTTAASPGTSAVDKTLAVPLGIRVGAIVDIALSRGTTGPEYFFLASSKAETDSTPSSTLYDMHIEGSLAASQFLTTRKTVWTDTSGVIRVRQSASAANSTTDIILRGWIDPLGIDD